MLCKGNLHLAPSTKRCNWFGPAGCPRKERCLQSLWSPVSGRPMQVACKAKQLTLAQPDKPWMVSNEPKLSKLKDDDGFILSGRKLLWKEKCEWRSSVRKACKPEPHNSKGLVIYFTFPGIHAYVVSNMKSSQGSPKTCWGGFSKLTKRMKILF